MSTRTDTRKIPAPLYAAAGAGDLAYQQLRKLPERVAELRERVAELRPAGFDVGREAARCMPRSSHLVNPLEAI